MCSLGTRVQNGFEFTSAVWDNDYLSIQYYLKQKVFGTVVPDSPNLSAPSFIRWYLKIFQGWNFENVSSDTKYFQVGCYPYFFSGQDTYPRFQKPNILYRFIGGNCLLFVLEDDSHTSFLVAGKPFFIGPICLQSELHIVNVE